MSGRNNGGKSDFIMTIEDDPADAVQLEADDDEDIVEERERRSNSSLNESFSFKFEDDENELPWSFSNALKTSKPLDAGQTTVNEKIQRILQEKDADSKKRKRPASDDGKKSTSKKVASDDEDSDEESENEVIEGSDEEDEESEEEAPDANDDEDESDEYEAEDEEVEEEKFGKDILKEVKLSNNKKVQKFYEKVSEPSNDAPELNKSWEDLNLTRAILKGLNAHGYARPTPIQAMAIPAILQGKDIVGSAVTGSGKTGAFVLPILQQLLNTDRHQAITRVLILSPTRELAAQTHSYIEGFTKHTNIRCALVVGGLSLQVQEAELRSSPDIIVATPGRMIDHLRNSQSVGLDDIEFLIMDEADRLLDMGFRAELMELVKGCPTNRQTMLFSATMSDEVVQLVKLSLRNPVRVSVNVKFDVAEKLSQEFIKIKSDTVTEREAVVLALCKRTIKSKAIIFCREKIEAHRLKIIFGLSGLNASELHGNLTQAMRLTALEDFRDGRVDYLIATDLASRGLDILGIETVINFQMPRSMTEYVHRVGRTARAGSSGKAISIAGPDDRSLLKEIAKRARSQLKQRSIPPEAIRDCRSKVIAAEEDIKDISIEERKEADIRKAEAQIAKTEKMLADPKGKERKPKRTWFLENDERQQIKNQRKAEIGLPVDDKDLTPLEKKELRREQNLLRLKEAKKKEVLEDQKQQKIAGKAYKRAQAEVRSGLRPKSDLQPPKKKQKGSSSFEEEIQHGNFRKSQNFVKNLEKKKDINRKMSAANNARAKQKSKGVKGSKRRK
eukprot:TRINITY_DN6667_c0_g1_i1.p1 TRINITY_DN6667_c0_g1~~TRINITY_DN6667_c0_g1_i1.p1  ORF type:complete len:806 (-),score=241.23 TRINITY_DN6667_c0_g1_i1:2-2362(-)